MIDQNCVMVNWNVRGLNNPARRKVVRDLVSETKATVVALQETKLEVVDTTIISEVPGQRFEDSFVVLPAAGTRGAFSWQWIISTTE